MISIAERDFMTITEAAELLGISRQRMHEIIKSHKLQTVKFSKRTKFIKKSELLKLPEDRPNGVRIEYR